MVKKLLIGIIGLLLLSLIITIALVSKDSVEPMVNESDLRRDNLRLDHIKIVATQVQGYWDKHTKLPSTLGDLVDRYDYQELPKDPRYTTDYEYHMTGDQKYQICAIFSIETPRRKDDISKSGFWFHKADHYCFDFVVAQHLPPTPNEKLSEELNKKEPE